MKGFVAFAVLLVAVGLASVARSGHEFPVYPSYYPHEIQIETIPREQAADLLRTGKIHAYVGLEPHFAGPLPDSIVAVESLGSFVTVRVNPESPLAKNDESICAVARTVVREIARQGGRLIFHPYPVTPFHGDYLYHVDLADAAKARLVAKTADAPTPSIRRPKIRASSPLTKSLVRPDWYSQDSTWDVAIEEASAGDLVTSSSIALNGWPGPPWIRTGWFVAAQLLADAPDDTRTRDRVQADLHRLQTGAYESTVESIWNAGWSRSSPPAVTSWSPVTR